MKTYKKYKSFSPWTAFAFFAFLTMSVTVKAQTESKSSVAIIDFDTRGYAAANQGQCIQYIINELVRFGDFEVMDKYDIEYISKRDTLKMTGCFSKICLAEFGKRLQVNKIITGSISQLGDNVNVSIRLLDVEKAVFEKSYVKEFLNIPGNELSMIRVTMNEVFGKGNDQDLVNKLTKKADFDNSINNPYQLRLKSDGPRMGMTFLTGESAAIIKKSTRDGGYEGSPYMFQFGYQFEKQYLNEGNFQALFEFIPTVTGLDQGRFIPSVTFLNGLRNNVNGWEFAFGPTFSFSKYQDFYSVDGGKTWTTKFESTALTESRPDSRGDVAFTTGFLFAAGKTLKSGKLNLPVNLYLVPGKYGVRFGVSMGWNGKSRYEMRE